MTTLHVLAPKGPNNLLLARSCRRPARVALWLVGVFASATACSGSIDDNQAGGDSRPSPSAANPASTGARNSGPGVATGTASAAEETQPSAISARERTNDGIENVSGGARSNGSRREGGGARRRDVEDIDAGAIDAGDAGDAGLSEADAGDVEADGGQASDAGSAP